VVKNILKQSKCIFQLSNIRNIQFKKIENINPNIKRVHSYEDSTLAFVLANLITLLLTIGNGLIAATVYGVDEVCRLVAINSIYVPFPEELLIHPEIVKQAINTCKAILQNKLHWDIAVSNNTNDKIGALIGLLL
jgi:hypothetical protein